MPCHWKSQESCRCRSWRFFGKGAKAKAAKELEQWAHKTLIRWNNFIYSEPHDLSPCKISEGAWSAHLLGEIRRIPDHNKGARELHHQIAINTSTCFWCVAFYLRSGWLGGWLSSGVITEAILCLLDGKVRQPYDAIFCGIYVYTLLHEKVWFFCMDK